MPSTSFILRRLFSVAARRCFLSPQLALSLLLNVSANAQGSRLGAEIRGVVIDTSGHRLSNAAVNLLGTSFAASSNADGSFTIANVPAGEYAILTRKGGFEQLLVHANIDVPNGVDLLIRLVPEAGNVFLLDTVVTRATAPPRQAIADAQQRRSLGVGYLIARETIDKHTEWPMTSLLRATTTGITYVRHCSRGFAAAGSSDGSISLQPLRQPGCLMPPACYMQIVLDGLRIYSYDGNAVPPSLDDFRLQEVDAVEVYRGAETPAQYRSSGSVCGTILIWLRH